MSTLTCEKSVGTALLMQALVIVTAPAGLAGMTSATPPVATMVTASSSPSAESAYLHERPLTEIVRSSSRDERGASGSSNGLTAVGRQGNTARATGRVDEATG